MNHFEKHKQILETRFPELLALLEGPEGVVPPADIAVEVLDTPSGHKSLRCKGILVHSQRDPLRESEKLAQAIPGEGPAVVLGFGLGYAAQALCRLYPDRPLVIAERFPWMLRNALELRDASELLNREKVAFLVGGTAEAIAETLSLWQGEPALLVNRALRETDVPWYDALEAAVKGMKTKDEVNRATLRRFGKRWVRNLTANVRALRDAPGIRTLEDSCAGLPALIVAAGPSLDGILPLLPEIAERCIIVAADTALRALLSVSVEPDFVLVVDPQYWNARHLDRCRAPATCLVSESAVYPAVLRHGFSRACFCSSLFPLGRYIEDRTDPKGILGAGGSVATTAWDFARVIGASPLLIAGLDLSFPDLKTHFHGALFEERVHGESNRFAPAETRSVRALRDGQPFWAEAADGGRVLTDKRLSLYASWFEQRFRQYPQARPISLSKRGLRIKGMDSIDPGEVLKLPILRPQIDHRLSACFAKWEDDSIEHASDQVRGPAHGPGQSSVRGAAHGPVRGSVRSSARRRQRETDFEAALATLVDGLQELLETAKDSSMAIREWEKKSSSGIGDPGEILRSLDEADARIAASPVKDVAGFLFPPFGELERRIAEEDADAVDAGVGLGAADGAGVGSGDAKRSLNADTARGSGVAGQPKAPTTLDHHLRLSRALYDSLGEAVDYNLRYLKNSLKVQDGQADHYGDGE